MPLRSAEDFADALIAVHEADTPEERHEAAERFLEIEEDHWDKLHVERNKSPLIGRIISILVVVGIIVMGIIGISNAVELDKTQNNATYDIRSGQFVSCDLANAARRIQVRFYVKHGDRDLAEELVATRRERALHPHAARLVDRADDDCAGLYPLPPERGDDLPKPNLASLENTDVATTVPSEHP